MQAGLGQATWERRRLDSLTPRFAAEAWVAVHAHLVALFPDKTAYEEQNGAGETAGARSLVVM